MDQQLISFAANNYLIVMGVIIMVAAVGKQCERAGAFKPARALFSFTFGGCLLIIATSAFLAWTAFSGTALVMLLVWSWVTFLSFKSLRAVW